MPSKPCKTRLKRWIRKKEVEKGIIIMRVVTGIMAELGTTTTKVVNAIKKDGHQSDASFHNRKNGSKKWHNSE